MSTRTVNPTQWTEIPVTDLQKGMDFYSAVFGWSLSIDDTGPNPVAFLPMDENGSGTAGHLYPGKPAAKGSGPTVHFHVQSTVEDAIQRVNDAGGEASDMIIDIPQGRFAYGTDPDGNSIGLFQYNQG